MTDMREELAKHVYASMAWAYEDGSGNICPAWFDGGNSFAQDEARKRADAIIAALPGMIKPLEWEFRYNRKDMWCDTPLGTFSIGNIHGTWMWFHLTAREDQEYTFKGCAGALGRNSKANAKKAAQAHYTAQIMAAFGLPKQEGV